MEAAEKLTQSFLNSVPPSATSAIAVDLPAIQSNYLLTQKNIKQGCQIAAVVKADSYGLGMPQVAQALYEKGCRVFCVAFLEEGLKLRKTLPQRDAKIFVFSGVLEKTENYFLESSLIPTLVDRDQVKRWSQYARLKSTHLPAALHLDSGMLRNGLSFREVMRLRQDQDSLEAFSIEMIMSHLASSDNPEDPQNEVQRKTFERCLEILPKAPACLANSNGIALGESYHYDYVRPGLGLHGYATPYPQAHLLRSSLSVYSRIVQVQNVSAGQPVGYNHSYICKHKIRLATLGIGYADGIMRDLSNKGHVYIKNFPAPILGRISMDFMVIDVTDVPESLCSVGSWATIYPDAQNLHEMAYLAGTSPYELMANVGQRPHRIYLREGLKITEPYPETRIAAL